MTKLTLDSIASAKARLEEELRRLEAQEVQLRQQQSAEAYDEIVNLLQQYGQHFTANGSIRPRNSDRRLTRSPKHSGADAVSVVSPR